MPKAVREVKSFNLGIVTAADDNDIKIDAATYSQDIDPNSTEGRLRGRWKDLLIDTPIWRTKMHFTTPSADGDGDIPREIDAVVDGVIDNTLYKNVIYKVTVRLVGTIPTGDVTIRTTVLEFDTMSTYLKINDTDDTSGYPNSGEYIDLTFTSSNWTTVQNFYLVPQNITSPSEVSPKIKWASQTTDTAWNASSIDFTRTYNYVSDVIDGVIIERNTYKLHGVLEGVKEEYVIKAKLTSHPNFPNSDGKVLLTFTSSDEDMLKVHAPEGSNMFHTKTLEFGNGDWGTYQTLYPYAPDDGVKDGNRVHQILVTADSNNNDAFGALDANISTLVRFDDGNFLTNDFPYDGSSSWNVVVDEASTGGSGDDGTGDGDGSGDDGWTKP